MSPTIIPVTDLYHPAESTLPKGAVLHSWEKLYFLDHENGGWTSYRVNSSGVIAIGHSLTVDEQLRILRGEND